MASTDDSVHSAKVSPVQPGELVPQGIRACLFDLDGVLTKTAKVHAAAWKQMFDDYLRAKADAAGTQFRPFSIEMDYTEYVDGKLRQDGVRSFLASRGITLPEGQVDDPATLETVYGLGARKNKLVLELIRTQGVERYDDSIRYVEAVRNAGLRTAIVSSSKNCREVLKVTGIEHLFEVRIDGVVAAERGIPGKPLPDMFIEAATELGVQPAQAAVYEDAVAGVAAGHSGQFGWVVGVDRTGHAGALLRAGADIVVTDLSELMEDR